MFRLAVLPVSKIYIEIWYNDNIADSCMPSALHLSYAVPVVISCASLTNSDQYINVSAIVSSLPGLLRSNYHHRNWLAPTGTDDQSATAVLTSGAVFSTRPYLVF